jgi:nitrogen fixation/metabolism regulation signal transduction histidine kinase
MREKPEPDALQRILDWLSDSDNQSFAMVLVVISLILLGFFAVVLSIIWATVLVRPGG